MSKLLKSMIASMALIAVLTTQADAALITYTMTYTIKEVGPDVVLTGSGAFNLDGLGAGTDNTQDAGLGGSGLGGPFYRVGPGTGGRQFNVVWDPAIASTAFGSSNLLYTSIASGDRAGFDTRTGGNSRIFVPLNYVSGSQLNGTATFANTTLAALGLAVGDSASFTYRSDAMGSDGGLVTISAVPEPTSLLLVGGLVGLCGLRRRRR